MDYTQQTIAQITADFTELAHDLHDKGAINEWKLKELLDLGMALASGDIFFNPSITETFGNVTLEAMACGLPVVAAGATGAASLVADGETGRLVPPGKPDVFAPACAEALAPYCTDDALRLQHGANGEKAARAYSWDAINQAVVETYLRLHNERAAAG